MASKKGLIGFHADERRKEVVHKEDGVWRVESRQDCEHIVKAASIISDQAPGKDFRHIGFIPNAVLNQAFTEGWFHDTRKIEAWLNANPAFKTHG